MRDRGQHNPLSRVTHTIPLSRATYTCPFPTATHTCPLARATHTCPSSSAVMTDRPCGAAATQRTVVEWAFGSPAVSDLRNYTERESVFATGTPHVLAESKAFGSHAVKYLFGNDRRVQLLQNNAIKLYYMGSHLCSGSFVSHELIRLQGEVNKSEILGLKSVAVIIGRKMLRIPGIVVLA